MAERKLSEELRKCLEGKTCWECSYYEAETKVTCSGLLQKAHEAVKRYEEMFPCEIGDTVYVLAECKHIPEQIDGTLWDSNGAYGTATGYYCPYECNCPFGDEDIQDCEKYKEMKTVFEDEVSAISIDERGVWITAKNCMVNSQIGLQVFLTRQEAKAKLAEMEREEAYG